jgi:hypothetical protein
MTNNQAVSKKQERILRYVIDAAIIEIQTGGIQLHRKNGQAYFLYDTAKGRRGVRNAILKSIKQVMSK